MQSVSSRIWTRVAVSISYDDNHYTTGTSYISVTHPFLEVGFVDFVLFSLWVVGWLRYLYGITDKYV